MKRLLPVLLALLLAALPARAENACACPDAATHQARAAELYALLEAYHTMGAVVCLIENGTVTDTFVYGWRDYENRLPVTADTAFQVGSISKLVTGIGLMRLVERGLLRLDGDLGDVMGYRIRHPDYPDTPVTLRQLMTHSEGRRDNG